MGTQDRVYELRTSRSSRGYWFAEVARVDAGRVLTRAHATAGSERSAALGAVGQLADAEGAVLTAKYNGVPGCPRVVVTKIDREGGRADVVSDEAEPGREALTVPLRELSDFMRRVPA